MTSAQPPAAPPPHDRPSGPQAPPIAQRGPAVRPPLRRSATDKMAGGVCGGLAEYSRVDSLLWRVGFVGLTLAGGAGVVVYLLLWVLMPPGPRAPDQQPSSLDRLAEQMHEKVYASKLMPPRS